MGNVVSNYVSGVFGAQAGSILSNSSNRERNELYGIHSIPVLDKTGEGFYSGTLDGVDVYQTSRESINILDLLGEGEIEGLVSGEYVPSGNNNYIGRLGYEYVNFSPYAPSGNVEGFLRSVYLNEVPITNKNNLYNFQKVELAVFNGASEGLRKGDFFSGLSNNIENIKIINERLYGPDPVTTPNDPWLYYPKVFRLFNKYLRKIKVNIKVPSLLYVKNFGDFPVEDVGKTVGTSVLFKLSFRPLYTDGSSQGSNRGWYPTRPIEHKIEGLIRSEYIYQAEIDVYDTVLLNDTKIISEKLSGWEVEIVRITLDSIESHISNETFVDSIVEVSSDSLSYPNSAMASLRFDAEYFSQIPNRSYDVRLLKVKLPVGYDPITRQYSSEWNGEFQKNPDGTFKKQWTDNPAWIFYDLLTNKRYGLGKFIEEISIDKWTLYEISKYCDVLVSDGEGGIEPRFSCNTLINTKEEAYKVLQDFASSFRSIIYYGFGSLQAIQDKPREELAQFTNSNVENGNFSYSSSNKKNRPTVCLVRYNDRRNFYKPAIEYIEDVDAIKKFGILEKEITAFACTSRSQAIRLGRWILSTESSQTEMINFTVGAEGLLLRPGDVIRVADENRALENYGGRVIGYNPINNNPDSSITGITLDKGLTLDNNKSYTLFLTTPSFFYDVSLVDGLNSNHVSGIRKSHVQSFSFSPSSNTINISRASTPESVSGEFVREIISGTQINYDNSGLPMFENSIHSGSLIENAVWTLIDNDYSSNQYLITSIREQENLKYDVGAVIYEPLKYAFIESGITYSTDPVFSPPMLATPPVAESISLSLENYSTSTKKIGITITPPAVVGSTYGYKIFIKKNSTFNADDTVSAGSSLPKENFYFQTIFLSDRLSGGAPLQTFYIPSSNNTNYYVRVFSINSSSMLSNDYRESSLYVENHFPIRDVGINSLRLRTDPDEFNLPSSEIYRSITTKDASIKWDTTFLNLSNTIVNSLSLSYKIRIHPANTASSDLSSNIIQTFSTTDNFFTYDFDSNASSSNGPRRNFLMTVEAIDGAGEGSSNNFTMSSGWDLIEIDNPKPTNYFLTPRKDQGKRAGDQTYCDSITTEQYITADGLIKLNLRNNTFADLAGGYVYLSKYPFSGEDFINGRPKELIDRGNVFSGLSPQQLTGMAGSGTAMITGQYQIIEIPFDAGANTVLNNEIEVNPTTILKNNKIIKNSNYNFDYSNNYYMAVKFYDSFDRAIKDAQTDAQSSGRWENEYKNLHIGFSRDNVSGSDPNDLNAFTYKSTYSFGTGAMGYYLGDYTQGIPSCVKGTFSCPIYPTQYFSAGAENGFKYWIRINVNGQWEGNGISHVKILNAQDVKTLYNNFDGFYEYSCVNMELSASGAGEGVTSFHTLPNKVATKCRFRQASVEGGLTSVSTSLDDVEFGYYMLGGLPQWDKLTTGITRSGPDAYRTYKSGLLYEKGDIVYVGFEYPPGDNESYNLSYYYCLQNMIGASHEIPEAAYWRKFEPTAKAGIGYGGWGVEAYYQPFIPEESEYRNVALPDMDKIASYNEAGALISGKSRPLRGFRRYRVYFDENNLPKSSNENGLASYSIIGINCWNGSYESWPMTTGVETFDPLYQYYRSNAELERNILFAKDGADAFARSAISWLKSGDLFENIPGVWNHHPAGFGAGFGGLKKADRYFDVHLGRLIDDSYLNEAFFGVISTNNYTISQTTAWLPEGFGPEYLHEASWQYPSGYVTLPISQGGDGTGLNS